MKKLTAVVGGSIGADPYHPKTWSGIGPFLFGAMNDIGLLDRAVGVEIPALTKYWLLARNWNPNRAVWRRHFYIDAGYNAAMTKAAGALSIDSAAVLQTGSFFSLPKVFPSKICVSYNDGNLAQSVASGFNLEGVSRRIIDQGLRNEEATAHELTAVLTLSEYLRQSFITDYHLPPERVFNVGAGANLHELPAEQTGKDYSHPNILFIGIEFARKGGPLLLEAFDIVRQSMPSAELHLVGPKTPPPSLGAGVTFHGYLPKSDPAAAAKLKSLFENATLFCLPSLYEPFGIAPVEAMFYQIPCLVTDGWALRETVRPGENGDLVEKGSVEDLAAKLLALLGDPDKLAVMGRRARAMAFERFTWHAVVSRIAEVVNGLSA